MLYKKTTSATHGAVDAKRFYGTLPHTLRLDTYEAFKIAALMVSLDDVMGYNSRMDWI